MKNIKFLRILFVGLLIIIIDPACKKDLIDTIKKVDPGQTATYPLNGEYWVRLDSASITGSGSSADTTWSIDLLGGYVKITLFNTASNRSDSIWVDDLKNVFPFKVKASCNPAQKIFSINKGTEIYGDSIVTITSGKLILNKGITKGGNVTDSIHMHIQYGTDAKHYRLSGVRRTGFTEDEY